MARRKRNIPLRFKYVVLGDGLTEQYYLKHLKEINGYGYSLRPSFFDNISIFEANRIIYELVSGGCNKVIFITDYDTVVNQDKKEQFNKLVKCYEENPEVLICESMPSIEFWFLLHYKLTTRPYKNADETLKALRKFNPDFEKTKSFLQNIKWVEELCSKGKLEDAIGNAENILKQKNRISGSTHFPFTKIHLSIKEFENQKKGGDNKK